MDYKLFHWMKKRRKKIEIVIAVIIGATIGLALQFNPKLENFETVVLNNMETDSVCEIREYGQQANYFICSSYYYYLDCKKEKIKTGVVKKYLDGKQMKGIIINRKIITYLGIFNAFYKLPTESSYKLDAIEIQIDTN